MTRFLAILLLGALGGMLAGRIVPRLTLGAAANAAAGVAGGGLAHQAWTILVPVAGDAVAAGPLAALPPFLVALAGGAAFALFVGVLRALMAR